MDFYARFHKSRYPDLDGSPMHDPVCVAHVIDPTLMDGARRVHRGRLQRRPELGPHERRLARAASTRRAEREGRPRHRRRARSPSSSSSASARSGDARLRRDRAARQAGVRAAGGADAEGDGGARAALRRSAARRRRSSSRRTARTSTATSASSARGSSPSTPTSSSTPSTTTQARATPSSPTRASARSQADGLPAVGLTFGRPPRAPPRCRSTGAPASRSGSCARRRSSSRRAARSRTTSTSARARRSRAATGDRRVAFIASADHGHGHAPDGPYGFAPESAPYDEQIVELVRENRLGELAAWDAGVRRRGEGRQLLAAADAARRARRRLRRRAALVRGADLLRDAGRRLLAAEVDLGSPSVRRQRRDSAIRTAPQAHGVSGGTTSCTTQPRRSVEVDDVCRLAGRPERTRPATHPIASTRRP